jgi:hypothetical protein
MFLRKVSSLKNGGSGRTLQRRSIEYGNDAMPSAAVAYSTGPLARSGLLVGCLSWVTRPRHGRRRWHDSALCPGGRDVVGRHEEATLLPAPPVRSTPRTTQAVMMRAPARQEVGGLVARAEHRRWQPVLSSQSRRLAIVSGISSGSRPVVRPAPSAAGLLVAENAILGQEHGLLTFRQRQSDRDPNDVDSVGQETIARGSPGIAGAGETHAPRLLKARGGE